MKQEALKKKIKGYRVLFVTALLGMVGLNVLFTCLRTEGNHTAMLLCNVLTTTGFGWFLVGLWSYKWQPSLWLYALISRPREVWEGEILEMEAQTLRVEHFDCHKVRAQGRIFFLMAGSFELSAGQVRLELASNIIVGVEKL